MTIAITDVVLRDAHQSLFATRLRLDDMLPIAAQLDDVGYGSLECWGGATFDACIRFLGEDPWLRLRELKKAMPKTPLQMLLRGQNLLGYRHYADDVVERFVERAVKNGMDVFRVFDAMNDPRNMKAALQAVRSHGAHAQGTLSYTTSPAHTLQTWLDLTEQLLETGVDSGAAGGHRGGGVLVYGAGAVNPAADYARADQRERAQNPHGAAAHRQQAGKNPLPGGVAHAGGPAVAGRRTAAGDVLLWQSDA